MDLPVVYFANFQNQLLPLMNTLLQIVAVAATLLVGLPLVAQELAAEKKLPYPSLGAPPNPVVEAHWNRYHDYAQATDLLKKLAEKHPKFAKLKSLGKSYGGRDMWVLTVTNFEKGDENSRPAFWIDGAIHANEIQASEVVLYTAWFLLESEADNDTIKRLLNERVFFLMPMMSPDSRDAHFYEPNTTHSPRSGQRPIDDDMDGLVDEDPADDLDGDGHITMMRVKDPNGRYKSHPDFPALMIAAKENEKGEYRLLGQEGKDSDGDGEVNEDGDGYYDPNRDWGWLWQPKHIQRGAYRYPFSILENRLVADFIAAHPNIAGAQSYHNAGGMILRGPGAKEDQFEGADVAVYDQFGKRGAQLLPGYRYMHTAVDLYEVWGGENDWLHQVCGVVAFTNELWTPFNMFRSAEHGGEIFGRDELQHTFDKYLLLNEGVVPWHEFDHPEYGKIEIGGFKKSWIRQPPSFLLEEECHRNMAFTLFHADEMPLVKVQSIDIKSLGDGLRQVTAIVENPKIIPTHLMSDVKNKITRPNLVSISGDGLTVATAFTSNEPFFKAAREQKLDPGVVKIDRIAGKNVVYVRWLVLGEGPVTIAVDSVKGGKAELQSE